MARVVDQNVDCAKRRHGITSHTLNLFRIGDIRDERDCPPATVRDPGGDGLDFAGGAGHQRHRRPLGGEALGDGAADTASSTSHQRRTPG